MTPPMRWLALLATGGAVAGGAAAVMHGSAAGSTATGSQKSATAPPGRDAAQVRMLIAETKALQGSLGAARAELVRVLAHPGGHTIVYKTQTVSTSGTSSAASLAAEASSLAAERSQLQGESVQLGAEAQALGARQAALVKEAKALAAEAKKLSKAPSTHAHTGASTGHGGDD
jgi:hypothetical protein